MSEKDLSPRGDLPEEETEKLPSNLEARFQKVPSPQEKQERRFGKYILLQELGAGGMGEVVKAYDPYLRRYCAIKFIKSDIEISPEDIHRFNREAQALAKLSHPNIAAIYEAGELEGKHYICMQYIDGKPLSGLRLSVQDAVRIIRDVARAVAYAHQHKIIHRDIKPSNIIVDRSGMVYVMDFGLAKIKESSYQTITGSRDVMGTAAFMSPEQAKNPKNVDESSDVYSLGATLYSALTGKPPFTGPTERILIDLLTKDPLPPSKRVKDIRIPRELDIIVMKCLEREKRWRYQSARELAEDLDRYLQGKPIRARPASIPMKIMKFVKRNKVAAGVIFALFVILVGFGIISYISTRKFQRDIERVQKIAEQKLQKVKEAVKIAAEAKIAFFMGEEQKVEELSRKARELAPEHIAGYFWPMRLKLRKYASMMRLPVPFKVEGLIEFSPPPPESPEARELKSKIMKVLKEMLEKATEGMEEWKEWGEDCIYGSLAFFEGNYNEAETRFSKVLHKVEVLRKVPDPDVKLYSLFTDFYQKRFQNVINNINKQKVEIGDRMQLELYVRALEGLGLQKELKGNHEAKECYDDAIRLLAPLPKKDWSNILKSGVKITLGRWLESHGKGDDAKNEFEEALKLVENLDSAEAIYQKGEALFALASYYEKHGNGKKAEELYSSAIDAYRKSYEKDKSFLGSLVKLAISCEAMGDLKIRRGRSDEAWLYYENALNYFEEVIKKAKIVNARISYIELKIAFKLKKTHELEEKTNLYAMLVKELSTLCEEYNDNPIVFLTRGDAWRNWGIYKQLRGQDPTEEYMRAIDDYTEAIKINREYTQAYISRANANGNLGNYKQLRGQEPVEEFKKAISDYTEAIKINPQNAEGYISRGGIQMSWGYYKQQYGQDPTKEYRQAIKSYRKAIEINPEYAEAYTGLATTWMYWGFYKQQQGQDPIEEYNKAMDAYTRAIEVNPEHVEAYMQRGITMGIWGFYKHKQGQNSTKEYLQAIDDFTKVIEINPEYVSAYHYGSNTKVNLGKYKQEQGQDPTEEYSQAINDCTQAIKINPEYVEAYITRAIARMNWGSYKSQHGQDPTEEYTQAINEFTEAIKINPNHSEAYTCRGNAWIGWGVYKEAQGQDPTKEYAQAINDLTRAIEINSKYAEAYMHRGGARTCFGLYKESKGQNPSDDYKQALVDWEKAIQINPLLEKELEPHMQQVKGFLKERELKE